MDGTPKLARGERAHHWVIDEANGPTSAGRCRNCGATRNFRNWPAEEVLQRAEYDAA